MLNLLYGLIVFPLVIAFILGFLSYSLVEIGEILADKTE
jgi:hypothetical protein